MAFRARKVFGSFEKRTPDLPSSVSSSYNHRSRHNPGTSSQKLHEVQEHGVPQKGLKITNTSSVLTEETSNLVVS